MEVDTRSATTQQPHTTTTTATATSTITKQSQSPQKFTKGDKTIEEPQRDHKEKRTNNNNNNNNNTNTNNNNNNNEKTFSPGWKSFSTSAIPTTPTTTTIPTISPDPLNFDNLHPLQHRWAMWYDYPGKRTSQKSWAQHLQRIMDIDTVEDFWRLYNNIATASKLVAGSNYHLFRDGMKPTWEDANNIKGGKWVLNLSNKARHDQLDKLWLWTLLAVIGEAFEDEDEVCGCVVSIRNAQDRIALWTRHSNNSTAIIAIGKQLKQILELSSPIGYQAHADSLKHNSSFNNKSLYEV